MSGAPASLCAKSGSPLSRYLRDCCELKATTFRSDNSLLPSNVKVISDGHIIGSAGGMNRNLVLSRQLEWRLCLQLVCDLHLHRLRKSKGYILSASLK